MKRTDVWTSVILLVLSLAGIFRVIPQESVPGEPGELAPADLPSIALWLVVACCLWQLVSAFRNTDDTPTPLDRFAVVFVLCAAALLFLLLAGIWQFGYISGGVLCILAVAIIMRPAKPTWVWLVPVALVLPVSVYYLSWHGLRLSLP